MYFFSILDFLVGIFCQPLFIVCRVAELTDHLYMLCFAVRLQTVIGVICMAVSLVHSCLISFDRYLAVRFPTRYKVILTNGRVLATVALTWLCATAFVVFLYFGFSTDGRYMLIGRTICIVLVLAVTAVFYIAAFFEFKGTFTRCNFNQIASRANLIAPGPPLSQAVKVNHYLHNVNKAEKNSSNDSADQCLHKQLQSNSYRCRSMQIPRMKDMPRFSKKDNTLLRRSSSWTNEVFSSHNLNREYSFKLPAVSGCSNNEAPKSDQFPLDGGKLRQISNDVQNLYHSQCDCYNGRTHKQQSQLSLSLRKKKEKKLAKTMLVTVGILVVCFLPPVLAYSLLPTNQSDMEMNWLVLNWLHTLVFLNSCFKPFWFCWRMQNLRKSVLKLVKRN